MTLRNMILTGGPSHPFDETAPMVARLLEQDGLASDVTDDIEGGLARLSATSFDLVTVHCLRWTMSQNEKYAPLRATWGLDLSANGREALTAHVARGGGLLGLHTASIAFDTWPEWRDVLGAAWRWDRSHHPPYGPVSVSVMVADHPVTRGVSDFACDDELYSELDLAPDARVLATARVSSTPKTQPIALVRQQGRARIAYLGLGHDRKAFETPAFARMVRQAACWCIHAGPAEPEPA